MATIYKVLIVIAVLVVLFLLYRSHQNKKAASQAAQEALNSGLNGNSSLPPGGSSQVSQVIASLFPYFNTAVENDLIGGKKNVT